MRQRERNQFMKLYDKNPNIKMLVLFADDEKIKSRALLWESGLTDGDGKEWKIMDRIYTFFDHDVDVFKKWADGNEYKLSHYNGNNNEQLTTKVKVDFNKQFPYLDSFRFMSFNEDDQNNTATLYTQEPRGRRYFLLNETNGTFQLRN
jgi:hypothetical protein